MQLYALDQNLNVIHAKNAKKHFDYQCLECKSFVRLRGGIHRQNHFYHIFQTSSCKQSGKSMEHLQVQLFLQKELDCQDLHLEKRFNEIGRIADVVSFSKKLVFEVQCSPISLEEVKSRNLDYQKLGLSVIWILHEKNFNQSKVSAVEDFLQSTHHYFTNMDANGLGVIYDQFDLFDKGKRIFSSKPFIIDVKHFFQNDFHVKNQLLPSPLLQKISSQPSFFKGDLVDYCKSEHFSENTFIQALTILESRKPKKLTIPQFILHLLKSYIMRPYRIFLNILLEKATL